VNVGGCLIKLKKMLAAVRYSDDDATVKAASFSGVNFFYRAEFSAIARVWKSGERAKYCIFRGHAHSKF
jgi:hypothetical protein